MKEEPSIEKSPGDGKPIVFIHGWLGSKDSWTQVRKKLDLENPLIFYDQRCHGESFCREFRIEDLVKDLKTIIKGLEKQLFIVAHSLGGMVALKYASQEDNYAGLVLLATSASTPRPKYKSPTYFLNKLNELPREEWAEMIADNYAENSPQFREETIKELKKANKKPIIHGLETMINYDVRDNIGELNSIVIAGKKDYAITQDQCKQLSNFLKCKINTIESSHLMLQEKPAEVAEQITKFVNSRKTQ